MSLLVSCYCAAGGSRQCGARRLERLTGHHLGIPRPGGGVRGLVGQIPLVTDPRQPGADLAEGDAPLAGGEAVQAFAGHEALPWDIAELEVHDLLETLHASTAPLQMVRVQEHPAVRVAGQRQCLAHAVEGVVLLALRVGLQRQADAVLLGDVADFAQAGRGALDIPPARVHRAHHGGAPKLHRPAAGFVEGPEEPRALGALGEQEAHLHPDAGDR